tara:strand:+ start:1485 stop:2684 length:1200 start_codon:yes stop_codon:yes gene_type:complete
MKDFLKISSVLVALIILGNNSLHSDKSTAYASDEVPVEDIEQFVDIYKRIKEQYVDEVNDDELFKNAIQGMVNGLDPHSDFLSKDDFDELKIGTTGRFGGLGIEISQEERYIKVISPIDDTPAMRAGIIAGDMIIKVDDKDLKDVPINDAVKLMRGEPGTSVEITILRKNENKPIVLEIQREIIISKGIKTKIFDKNIGYIRLSNFQSNSTSDLQTAFYKLNKQSNNNLQGLIVDLRNNPGGVLGAAVGITDLFLQSGKIVETKGRSSNSELRYEATARDISNGMSLVILINEGSASASEIVAGALQDNKRATILGTKSYGKASVQTIQELSDGSALKLTTAKYYTPLGKDIHENGIMPDVVVELSESDKVSLPKPYDKDKQLFEAIKILSENKVTVAN